MASFSMFLVTVILSKILLFAAMAWHGECVKHPLQGSRHPQISAFYPLELKLVLLDVYCFGLIKCPKEVLLRHEIWYLLVKNYQHV